MNVFLRRHQEMLSITLGKSSAGRQSQMVSCSELGIDAVAYMYSIEQADECEQSISAIILLLRAIRHSLRHGACSRTSQFSHERVRDELLRRAPSRLHLLSISNPVCSNRVKGREKKRLGLPPACAPRHTRDISCPRQSTLSPRTW